MGLAYRTGTTITDLVYSININNNPVVPTTFDIDVYKNGSIDTGTTVSVDLKDASTGAYVASWSASTVGDYQIYLKNNSTKVVFISDTYRIRPDDEFDVKVFVGI